MPQPEHTVLMICCGLIIVFSILAWYSYNLFVESPKKSYSISLGGNVPFRHNSLSLMISNNNNFSPKMVGVTDESISGSETDYTIFPSVFNGGQNFISPSDITFSGQPIRSLTVTPGHVSNIDVAVNKILDPGVYYGSFILLGSETIRVPAVISTSPIISVLMIVVFIGIFSSIALVEFGKFKDKEASYRLTTKANVEQGVKDMAFYKVERYKLRYDGLGGQTRTTLIDVIPGLLAMGLAYVGLVNNEIVGTITDLSFQNVIWPGMLRWCVFHEFL